jgi:dTDP-4-dehydrorhamnose reductase
MKHRILLLGATGQVGWEMQRSLPIIGDVTPVSRTDISPTLSSHLWERMNELHPTIVVNAAAYTAVDKAESDYDECHRLNAELPSRLAEWSALHQALLVDFSTDYVFDGTNPDPYRENDKTNPLNQYGATKLEGLRAIQSSDCRHLVFRVSWVYSARRSNFLRTILRLASERSELKVINDQVGTPTPARWIADATAHCLSLLDRGVGQEGLYNLTPAGFASWYEFARLILQSANRLGIPTNSGPDDIDPIPTTDYPTPAARPMNSCLCKDRIESAFDFELPGWKTFVPLIVQECLQK